MLQRMEHIETTFFTIVRTCSLVRNVDANF
jgi:hypothetical protein